MIEKESEIIRRKIKRTNKNEIKRKIKKTIETTAIVLIDLLNKLSYNNLRFNNR